MAILLNNDMKWFYSEQGIATFKSINRLEERIYFVMAFLRSVMRESDIAEKIQTNGIGTYQIKKINESTTQIAVFLADAIFNSDLPYATYPALIDPQKNPFLKYWISKEFGYEYVPQEKIFEHFSSIIYEENKKYLPENTRTFKQQVMEEAGENGSPEAFEQLFKTFPHTEYFDLTPSLQLVQLKNIWIYSIWLY